MGTDKKEIRRYYDNWAPEYAQQYVHELDDKPLDRYILTRFADVTKDRGRVCDLGCGPGHVAGFLEQKGVAVFGIDLSAGMIQEAKKQFPTLDFYVADMLALPVHDNELAGISAFYSIVNLGPAEILPVIKEFYRTVRPDGYILLAFHIGDNEVIRANKRLAAEEELSADFVFHNYETVLQCLEANTFILQEAFIRYPYRKEYQSRRAYILAQKTAEKD